MALFSRRKSTPAADKAGSASSGSSTSDEASAPAAAAPENSDAQSDVLGTAAEQVPQVGISVSTYGKPQAGARPVESVAPTADGTGIDVAAPSSPAAPRAATPTVRPPAEAPARTETVPGLPDNVLVKQALASLPDKPQNADIINVMRQMLQGHIYVRAQGNAQELIAAGTSLTLAITSFDDKRFLLAYTGGAALQASIKADGDTATSAVGQPTVHILRNVAASDYDGLYLDHAVAGARVILPSQLVVKALEEADPEFTIKNLLAAPRSEQTASAVAEALTRVKLWVAGRAHPESGQIGLAEARTPSGERRLEVFSHPLEVIAMGRGDKALPLTGEQLGKALAAEPALTGVVVDPAGPWIELDRAQLQPVISLATA